MSDNLPSAVFPVCPLSVFWMFNYKPVFLQDFRGEGDREQFILCNLYVFFANILNEGRGAIYLNNPCRDFLAVVFVQDKVAPH